MTYYDDPLRQAHQQVARVKQLEAMLTELRAQKETLSKSVSELEKIKLDEQKDVDRLEGRSLAAFFYNVIGKKDEKLDEERREAYAARVKYDSAVRELAGVEMDIRGCEGELADLQGCQQRYDALLQEKLAAIKTAGGAYAEQILGIEEKIAALDAQKRELAEAIEAGNSALSVSKAVMDKLDSAGDYATWDVLGGGLLADALKHSALDDAQNAVERLQSELRKFKTELADVTIEADLQVSIDGFTRFADYFFDNLFTDWTVMDKITNAQNNIRSTRKQIKNILKNLQQMQEERTAQQEDLQQQIGTLAVQL